MRNYLNCITVIKGTFFLFLFLLLNHYSFAQNISDSSPPASTSIDHEAKFKDDKLRYADYYLKHSKARSSIDLYLAHSNYDLDVLFKSGAIIYSKPIADYVLKVFDKVCKEKYAVKNPTIYLIKASEANAFIYHSNEIFITTGLIAQLENEAQLAYILAHELSHSILKHHIKGVIASEDNRNKARKDNSITEDVSDLMLFQFSQELEFQADSLGLRILKETEYGSEASLSSMDVLQFSHLPFNEIPFHAEQFFGDSLNFPKACLKEQIQPINFDSDKENDTWSTHPNVAKRRKQLEIIVSKTGAWKGNSFSVSKSDFISIRRKARIACIEEWLYNGDAILAFYNAYVLQKEESDDEINRLIAKSLYEIAMQKQFDTFDSNNSEDDFKEGEIQRAYYFFDALTDEQALFFALKSNFQIGKAQKKEFFMRLTAELMKSNVINNSIIFSDITSYFVPVKPVSDTNRADTNQLVQDDAESKYAKIRKQKLEAAIAVKNDTIDYSAKFHFKLMKDMINDTSFVNLYKRIEDKYYKQSTGKESGEETTVVTFNDDSKESDNKVNGIESTNLLLFSPVFSMRVSNHEDFFKLQDGQHYVENSMGGYFDKAGIKNTVISWETIKNMPAEKYREYSAIMEYSHELITKSGKYLPLSSELIQNSVIENYSHIMLTRYSRNEVHRQGMGQAILTGILFVPLLPSAILYCLHKEKKQRCDVLIIDLKTNKVITTEHVSIEGSKFPSPSAYFTSFIKQK